MNEVTDEHDKEILRDLISQHEKETGSPLAKHILKDFEQFLPHFKKIVPNDYHRMLVEISNAEQRGLDHEEALLEAFRKVTA